RRLVPGDLVDRAARVGAEQHAAVGELERRPHGVAFERDALGLPAGSHLAGRHDERARRVTGVELLIGLDRPRRRHDRVGAEREQSEDGKSPEHAWLHVISYLARTRNSAVEVPLTTRLARDTVRAIGLYAAARCVWLCGWSLSSALAGRSRTSLPSSATPS